MPAIPAIIGAVGALGAAAMQNKGAKDAANSQANQNASDRQFQVDMANQARTDVTGMYPQMQQNAMLGGQAALSTMRNAMPQQTYARQQGTQNAIAALLGGQGKQIQPNFDFMPQQLPNYQTYQNSGAVGQQQDIYSQAAQAQSAQAQSGDNSLANKLLLGGYVADPRDAFNPKNMLTNPLATLGVGKKVTDKIDPVKVTKKLFGGLF